VGPKVAWWPIRGVPFSLHLLPLGGFVRFPSMEEEQTTGFAAVKPWRHACIAVSASAITGMIGWFICNSIGFGDAPLRAIRWLGTSAAWSWSGWRALAQISLEGLSNSANLLPGFAIVALAMGLANLLPIQPFSGGIALTALLKPLLPKGLFGRYTPAINIVSILISAFYFGGFWVALFVVLFSGPK
jgi:hypothetical protein